MHALVRTILAPSDTVAYLRDPRPMPSAECNKSMHTTVSSVIPHRLHRHPVSYSRKFGTYSHDCHEQSTTKTHRTTRTWTFLHCSFRNPKPSADTTYRRKTTKHKRQSAQCSTIALGWSVIPSSPSSHTTAMMAEYGKRGNSVAEDQRQW
jgi:hypothetical protein